MVIAIVAEQRYWKLLDDELHFNRKKAGSQQWVRRVDVLSGCFVAA